MTPRLVLYGREACHLCDEMERRLCALLQGHAYQLQVEDVESRDDWLRAYGLRIPVLTTGAGRELCEVWLDEATVLDYVAVCACRG